MRDGEWHSYSQKEVEKERMQKEEEAIEKMAPMLEEMKEAIETMSPKVKELASLNE